MACALAIHSVLPIHHVRDRTVSRRSQPIQRRAILVARHATRNGYRETHLEKPVMKSPMVEAASYIKDKGRYSDLQVLKNFSTTTTH